MCRLAAFPPGYTKKDAIALMEQYGSGNRDGVGIAYAKDGELVVKKWATDWDSAIKKNDIFAHMPHAGWTIAHVRAATHGEKTPQNTHPFIRGDWAICHNGIFGGHRIGKALLTELGSTFEGQTDSEVGAELINKFGPKRFPRFASDHDGTWLALNKDGELYVVVTGGACDLFKLKGTKGKFVIASSLSNEGVKSVDKGWLRFNDKGKLRSGKYELEKKYNYSSKSYGSGEYEGYGGYGSGVYGPGSRGGSTTESERKQADWEKNWEKKWGKPGRNGNQVINYSDLVNRDAHGMNPNESHWHED